MSKAKQPPFKCGEWVTNGEYLDFKPRLLLQVDHVTMTADPTFGSGYSICGVDAPYFRPAAARELRAESKRLAARAAALAKAADAVSAKKGAGR